jgi:hypothetical protein
MRKAFSSGFSHFASSGKSDRKKYTTIAISTVKAPSMMNNYKVGSAKRSPEYGGINGLPISNS